MFPWLKPAAAASPVAASRQWQQNRPGGSQAPAPAPRDGASAGVSAPPSAVGGNISTTGREKATVQRFRLGS